MRVDIDNDGSVYDSFFVSANLVGQVLDTLFSFFKVLIFLIRYFFKHAPWLSVRISNMIKPHLERPSSDYTVSSWQKIHADD